MLTAPSHTASEQYRFVPDRAVDIRIVYERLMSVRHPFSNHVNAEGTVPLKANDRLKSTLKSLVGTTFARLHFAVSLCRQSRFQLRRGQLASIEMF